MAQQPESRLVNRIMAVLKALPDSFWVKNHGSAFSLRGLPDITGCYQGRFWGIEVKRKKWAPTPIQTHRLQQIQRAGGIVGVVHSIEELHCLLEGATGADLQRDRPTRANHGGAQEGTEK